MAYSTAVMTVFVEYNIYGSATKVFVKGTMFGVHIVHVNIIESADGIFGCVLSQIDAQVFLSFTKL